MAGSKAGGKLAAETNRKMYGKDFYKKIGAMGGKKGHTGGFYANRELASSAGRLGGRTSTRAGIKNGDGVTPRPRRRNLLGSRNVMISNDDQALAYEKMPVNKVKTK